MPTLLYYFLFPILGAFVTVFYFRFRISGLAKHVRTGIARLRGEAKLLVTPAQDNLSWVQKQTDALIEQVGKAEVETQHHTEHETSISGLKNQEALEELEARNMKLEIINELGQSVTSSLTAEESARHLYKSINSLMDAAVVELGIYSWNDNSWEYYSNLSNFQKMDSHYVNPLAEWSLKNEREVVLSNAEEEFGKYVLEKPELPDGSDPRSILCFPIFRRGKEQGVLTIYSLRSNAFDGYQHELLRSLIPFLSIAVDNSSAHRKLVQAQNQLIENERMALIGQLSSGIAQEIADPLSNLKNFSEMSKLLVEEIAHLGNVENPGELISQLSDNLEKISFHGNQAFDVVKNILLLSRKGEALPPLNINKILSDFLNLTYQEFQNRFPGFTCTIKKDLDLQIPLKRMNAEDISRVIYNIYKNAFYTINEKVKKRENGNADYSPELQVSSSFSDKTFNIRIRDNGMGIPDEIKDKVFLPFFSTKPIGQGTGLGLSLARTIIESENNGRISIQSELGHWTEVQIELPE